MDAVLGKKSRSRWIIARQNSPPRNKITPFVVSPGEKTPALQRTSFAWMCHGEPMDNVNYNCVLTADGARVSRNSGRTSRPGCHDY